MPPPPHPFYPKYAQYEDSASGDAGLELDGRPGPSKTDSDTSGLNVLQSLRP